MFIFYIYSDGLDDVKSYLRNYIVDNGSSHEISQMKMGRGNIRTNVGAGTIRGLTPAKSYENDWVVVLKEKDTAHVYGEEFANRVRGIKTEKDIFSKAIDFVKFGIRIWSAMGDAQSTFSNVESSMCQIYVESKNHPGKRFMYKDKIRVRTFAPGQFGNVFKK